MNTVYEVQTIWHYVAHQIKHLDCTHCLITPGDFLPDKIAFGPWTVDSHLRILDLIQGINFKFSYSVKALYHDLA